MNLLSSLTLNSAFPDLWEIGDDVRISHHINVDYDFPQQFLLKDFVVVYVKQGTVSGRMNGVFNSHSAPCMLTLSDRNVYSYLSSTSDIDAVVISFSSTFAARLNILNRFQLNEMLSNNPMMPLNKECQSLLERFIDALTKLGENPQNPYLDDALLHLVLYFFYGIGYFYYQLRHQQDRLEQVTTEFCSLVEKYGTQKRNIAFYAERLRLSPKYVQTLIKKSTGRSAYTFIEDALLKEAKRLLTQNEMTIQQISNHLKFCDQSYFTAFFKRMTGTTPKAYREQQSR